MANDDVGYKKPPVHSRFQKGKSGNPRGRPKGSTNYLTLLRRVLDQKVTVSEDGKSRQITKIEAAMTQLLNNAARGDIRAFQATLKVVALLGLKPPDDDDRTLIFVIEE
jgi:hypothetical protein